MTGADLPDVGSSSRSNTGSDGSAQGTMMVKIPRYEE